MKTGRLRPSPKKPQGKRGPVRIASAFGLGQAELVDTLQGELRVVIRVDSGFCSRSQGAGVEGTGVDQAIRELVVAQLGAQFEVLDRRVDERERAFECMARAHVVKVLT